MRLGCRQWGARGHAPSGVEHPPQKKDFSHFTEKQPLTRALRDHRLNEIEVFTCMRKSMKSREVSGTCTQRNAGVETKVHAQCQKCGACTCICTCTEKSKSM